MAWATISADEVLSEFTPQEKTILDGIQAGTASSLAGILTRAINEVRGAIAAGNYPVGASATVPDGLASDVIAIARWRFLIAFPALKNLQTEARKQAFTDAQAKLKAISKQEFAVESPTAGVQRPTGQWNSENKLVMRTHPVPPASTQFTGPNQEANS
ncbi:MAG: hypothetical protein WCO56_11445 [Verrucomicrobiota bacterium]